MFLKTVFFSYQALSMPNSLCKCLLNDKENQTCLASLWPQDVTCKENSSYHPRQPCLGIVTGIKALLHINCNNYRKSVFEPHSNQSKGEGTCFSSWFLGFLSIIRWSLV